jgi:hypothetical protein
MGEKKKELPGNVNVFFKSWKVLKPLLSMISVMVRIPHLHYSGDAKGRPPDLKALL